MEDSGEDDGWLPLTCSISRVVTFPVEIRRLMTSAVVTSVVGVSAITGRL